MIPKRLVRTVPHETSPDVEVMWDRACRLHPEWDHIDLRDPVNRDDFPIASHLWDTCDSGSQKSDLIRAEELYHRGGVYIDSDVDCYRPFDSLLGLDGFAAYEDMEHICTAVIGFAPQHPAVHELLLEGIRRHDEGAWAAAIGVASEIWPGRNDMALLPPGSFYPVHYHERWADRMPHRWVIRKTNPWAYCCHLWDGSWLKKSPT
jgi:hypothetical protein